MSDLLKLKAEIKAKKPNFIKQSSYKLKKLSKAWRRPRGLHSKQRLRYRGYLLHISSGYGVPKEVWGLHSSGLKPVLVCCEKEIGGINPAKDCAIISKNVGTKKKVMLVKKLKEKNVKIINIKDADSFIKEAEEKYKKKIEEKKTKEKESQKKKADEKPKDQLAEKVMTEEEKKENEKKEKDRLLTKKA